MRILVEAATGATLTILGAAGQAVVAAGGLDRRLADQRRLDGGGHSGVVCHLGGDAQDQRLIGVVGETIRTGSQCERNQQCKDAHDRYSAHQSSTAQVAV